MSLFSYDRRKVLTISLFNTYFLSLRGARRRGNLKQNTDRHGFQKSLAMTFVVFSLWLTANPAFATGSVVINEFLPNPISGNDWVELYNPTSNPVDIGNWYLKDEATTHIADFSLSTSISAENYLAIDVGSRLNKDNDTVTLYNNVNETVDSRTYSQNPGDNISIGRYPDGEIWATLQNSTKGNSNNGGNPVPTPTPAQTPTSAPIAPTPTSTLTQTPTSAPAATSKPTIVSSPTPVVKPSIILADSTSQDSTSDNGDFPEIDLAINDAMNPSPSNQPEVLGTDSAKTSKPTLPVILIIAGTLLTLIGGLLLAYQEVKRHRK